MVQIVIYSSCTRKVCTNFFGCRSALVFFSYVDPTKLSKRRRECCIPQFNLSDWWNFSHSHWHLQKGNDASSHQWFPIVGFKLHHPSAGRIRFGRLAQEVNPRNDDQSAWVARSVSDLGEPESAFLFSRLKTASHPETWQQCSLCYQHHDSAYRHTTKGAWPFSTKEQGYTVSDCTAEALKAVIYAQEELAYVVLPLLATLCPPNMPIHEIFSNLLIVIPPSWCLRSAYI